MGETLARRQMESSVREAVRVLYSPTSDDSGRQQAGRFLELFQNKIEAWNVAIGLLNSSQADPELVLFASQTIKHKIVSDFIQCDEGTVVSLRDTLWALLFPAGHNSTQIAGPVATQLSLALAALAVQCNAGLWPDPLGQVLARLEDAQFKKRVLAFLAHLPEQLVNRRIPLPRDFFEEQRQRLIEARFPEVMQVLAGQLSQADCRSDVLAALHSWVRYGSSPSEAGASFLAAPGLLQTAFTFIKTSLDEDGGQLDEAVDLACEIFFRVHQMETPIAEDWFAVLFAGLRAVYPSLAQGMEDEDVVRKLAMLFAEVGEAFLTQFMGNPVEMEPLLAALLSIAESSPDLEALQTTFPFWEALSARLSGMREEAVEAYRPVYTRLFRTAVHKHLAYPVGGTAEQLDAFRDFRHVVGDALKDCVRAIGSSDCLSIVQELFNSRSTSGDWRPVEAVLFAFRTIGSAVDRRESEVLPVLYGQVLTLRPSPACPSKLVYGVLLVMGVYADWLRYHVEFLPTTLEYIAAALGLSDTSVGSASVQALRYLCESCGRQLAAYLPALSALYEQTCESATVTRADRVDMSAAIGYVLESPEDWKGCIVRWVQRIGANSDSSEAFEHLGALIDSASRTSASTLEHHFRELIWPALSSCPIPTKAEDKQVLVDLLRTCVFSFGPFMDASFDAGLLDRIEAILSSGYLPAIGLIAALLRELDICRSGLLCQRLFTLLIGCTQSLLAISGTLSDLADYFAACTALVQAYGMQAEILVPVLDLVQLCLAQTPAEPADVTSAYGLLCNILSTLINEPDSASLVAALQQPLCKCTHTALLSTFLGYHPPHLLSDLAPFLLRLHRLTPALPSAVLLETLRTCLPQEAVLGRELELWAGQFSAALQSERAHREVKEFLRILVSTCQRRIQS